MLDEKLKLYEKTFGDAFPTFVFMYLSEDEMCKLIDECVNDDQSVYDKGLVTDDADVLY